jgi:hypothetical protein
MDIRPLYARLEGAVVEQIPFQVSDGTRLGLTRVRPRDRNQSR